MIQVSFQCVGWSNVLCALWPAACCKVQEQIWSQLPSIKPASWSPFSKQGAPDAKPGLHENHLCTQGFIYTLCPLATPRLQRTASEAPRVEAISHQLHELQEEIPKEDTPAAGCDRLRSCVLRDLHGSSWQKGRHWEWIPGDPRAADPQRFTPLQ